MTESQTFRYVYNNLPFACILIDGNDQIRYINSFMAENLIGNDLTPTKETQLHGFIPESERETFNSFLENIAEPLNSHTWKLFKFESSNGFQGSVLWNGTTHQQITGISGGIFLVGVPLTGETFSAILNNSSSQSLLKKLSNDKYQSLFNSVIVGIAILNDKGNIKELNEKFADHIGLSRNEILNRHYSDIISSLSKEKMDELFKIVKREGKNYVKEVLTVNENHPEHVILEVSFSNFTNKSEPKENFMLITEDITHQQDTHAALLQSEKLALTGRLAASLAHEINNPLQTSLGCLGLAEEMLDGDSKDLRVYIKMAMDELQRSARIVKKLRDLNRRAETSEKSEVDLKQILEGVLILTKNRLYDRGITPVFTYHGSPPKALASKDQIQQVVLNLVMNAIDALHDGGKIYMDINRTFDPLGVKVSIRDTGTGIKEEFIEKIFDPFLTTKEDGLGLGLYICKQIIEDHGGSLNVNSETGKGSEFWFWLPARNSEMIEE